MCSLGIMIYYINFIHNTKIHTYAKILCSGHFCPVV